MKVYLDVMKFIIKEDGVLDKEIGKVIKSKSVSGLNLIILFNIKVFYDFLEILIEKKFILLKLEKMIFEELKKDKK